MIHFLSPRTRNDPSGASVTLVCKLATSEPAQKENKNEKVKKNSTRKRLKKKAAQPTGVGFAAGERDHFPAHEHLGQHPLLDLLAATALENRTGGCANIEKGSKEEN